MSQHGHGACRFWAADISRIGDLSAGIQQHELDVLPFITFRDFFNNIQFFHTAIPVLVPQSLSSRRNLVQMSGFHPLQPIPARYGMDPSRPFADPRRSRLPLNHRGTILWHGCRFQIFLRDIGFLFQLIGQYQQVPVNQSVAVGWNARHSPQEFCFWRSC